MGAIVGDNPLQDFRVHQGPIEEGRVTCYHLEIGFKLGWCQLKERGAF